MHVDEINSLFSEEKFECELEPNKTVFIYDESRAKGYWCEGLSGQQIQQLKSYLKKHHLIIPRAVIMSLGVEDVDQKSIPNRAMKAIERFYRDAIKPKNSEMKEPGSFLGKLGKAFSTADVTKPPEFKCALIYGKDGNVCLVASTSILETLIRSLPKFIPQKMPMSQAIAIYNAATQNTEFESTESCHLVLN